MKPILVTAFGMCTAVGFNGPTSCAAMLAGISGAAQGKLWDAESGEFISACRVPLPQWWDSIDKHSLLAASTIEECLSAPSADAPEEVPILLGVAEPSRPHRIPSFDQELIAQVGARLGFSLNPLSRVLPAGQVSGVVGLDMAQDILDRGLARQCILVGVDSYLHQDIAGAYIARSRVLTPSNSNGFIPGEAAAAVLLSRQAPQTPHLSVLGWGIGQEPGTVDADVPLSGRGLSEAVESALRNAGTDIYQTQYRITDLNGEHYKFKEAAIVIARVMRRRHSELFDVWHPMEWLGEIGAAIVPCALAYQLYTSVRGVAPGPQCLGHFGTDTGERGAYVSRFNGGS